MESRTRTKTTKVAVGAAQFQTNWYRPERTLFYSQIRDSFRKERDLYGLMPPSQLRLVRSKTNLVTLSGRQNNAPIGSSNYRRCFAYGISTTWLTTSTDLPPSHWAKDKKNTYYANELIARSNPFRSDYSVPVMIKELIEVATMFKFLNRTLASTAGGAYLNYRFGWSAFLQDLKTLGGITRALERRLKEFQSLQQHGGLRRRIQLDSYESIYEPSTSVVNSSPAPLYVRATTVTRWHTEVWGTCRWFPAPGAWTFLDELTPLESFNLAVRSVFDLSEISPDLVWNLLPWSWLVDYFVEIGSYLGAISHQSLARAEYCCIMRRSRKQVTGSIIEAPSWIDVSGSPGGWSEILYRDVVPNKANLPSSFQLFNESEAKVILALLLKFR